MKTRDKILYCAQKLFSEEGFDKISAKKIAKESKCNEVTIFRIFKTKRGLLEAILNKFVEESKIIEMLSKNLTGDLDLDIKKSILIYHNFLEQHEIIFKLQLKLSDSEQEKFIRTIDFKNYLISYFEKLFLQNNIDYSADIFINSILTTIIGNFLLKILTKNSFCQGMDSYILDEKIKFYQNTIKNYKIKKTTASIR